MFTRICSGQEDYAIMQPTMRKKWKCKHLCVLVFDEELSRHHVFHIYAITFSISLILTKQKTLYCCSAQWAAPPFTPICLLTLRRCMALAGHQWFEFSPSPPANCLPATTEKIAGAACKNDTVGNSAGDIRDSFSCTSQGSDNGPCLKRTRRIDE